MALIECAMVPPSSRAYESCRVHLCTCCASEIGSDRRCSVRAQLAPAANPAGCLCHDVSLGARKSPQCLFEQLASLAFFCLCWFSQLSSANYSTLGLFSKCAQGNSMPAVFSPKLFWLHWFQFKQQKQAKVCLGLEFLLPFSFTVTFTVPLALA